MYLIMGDSSLTSFGFSSFFHVEVILSLVMETSVLIFSSSGVLSLLQVGDACWWKIDPCNDINKVIYILSMHIML